MQRTHGPVPLRASATAGEEGEPTEPTASADEAATATATAAGDDEEEGGEDQDNEADEAEGVAEEPPALSPYEQAVKDLENTLRQELSTAEAQLKTERTALLRTKDKVSESGKNGYFIVQAQVAEFQKKRDADQKSRVTRNKREFVEKMLPVVDAFREAPTVAPPTNEREENMHKNFGSLLAGVMTVFDKYGYVEYDAEEGSALNPARHQVAEVVEGAVDGVVVRQLKKGMANKEGEVLRRALVVASRAAGSSAPGAEADAVVQGEGEGVEAAAAAEEKE
jgi:molecular chaperone GrpE (heat shock protein)